MTSSPSDSSLAAEVADLRARLAALEAERTAARRRNRRLAFAAVGLAVISGTVASAANGTCPNGLPFCFTPDSPAQASQVNHNFMQLKEWLETKVGSTTQTGVIASTLTTTNTVTAGGLFNATQGGVVTNGLRVHAGGAVTAPTSAGRGLFVTGATSSYEQPILDVRHDNLTQGIGIGWSSINATGTAANQDLYLRPKGTGWVQVQGNLDVTGSISFGSRSCRSFATACSSQGGGEAIYLDRHDVSCNGGEYLRRFRLQTCSGGMQYAVTCCPI